VEPASAAGVAGIIKRRADLPEGSVVCTLTGHGLKDPETAVGTTAAPAAVPATAAAVAAALGW